MGFIDTLKYDSFCYSNLNGAIFTSSHFCTTNFSGASMLNTNLNNGSFCVSHDPIFTGADINNNTLLSIKPVYRKKVVI